MWFHFDAIALPSHTIFSPKEKTMTKTQAPVLNAGAGSEEKRRRPILTRASADELPSLGKTQRVDDILETVYAFRAVTAPMIAALFFPPGPIIAGRPKTHSNCQRILRELYHRGFVAREGQAQLLSDGRKPVVYWLAPLGAVEVARNREV